jgi:hypothetical protein
MEGNHVPNVDWSGGRSIDNSLRCDGTCCDEGRFHLEFESGDWWLLDADWHRVVPAVYCPWCGKRLEKV